MAGALSDYIRGQVNRGAKSGQLTFAGGQTPSRGILTEEESLRAMDPVSALKLAREAQNARVYTPEEQAANLKQTGTDLAYSTPILGNVLSAMDVPGYARETARHARAGDDLEAHKSMLATELSMLGAIPMLPFGGTAGAASRTNIFAGPMAKTADHAALENAQRLAKAGASRDEIWNQTGWFAGPDGQWRFEIPDNQARISTPMAQPDGSMKFSGIDHPDLRSAYGEPVEFHGRYGPNREIGGSYSTAGNDAFIYAQGPTENAAKSAGLHESQHDVQAREGFGRGASVDYLAHTGEGRPVDIQAYIDFLKLRKGRLQEGTPEYLAIGDKIRSLENEGATDAYHRTSGEVEARNVQTRMNMTPAERRATPPWLTQDVPDDQQIVRARAGGSQQSVETGKPTTLTLHRGSTMAEDPFTVSSDLGGRDLGLLATDSEARARGYAESRPIIPGMPRGYTSGNEAKVFADWANKWRAQRGEPPLSADEAASMTREKALTDVRRPQVHSFEAHLKNPLVVDLADPNSHQIFEDAGMVPDVYARARGHDAIIYKNSDDGPEGGLATNVAILSQHILDAARRR